MLPEKLLQKIVPPIYLVKIFNIKTYANYNNQIGVPLMLLQLDDTYQVAVIEIGTNEPGEIEALSEIVLPTHGLITNIGKEHLEKLIDLDGVEKEETALFRHLDRQSCIALINIDDERLQKYIGNKNHLHIRCIL